MQLENKQDHWCDSIFLLLFKWLPGGCCSDPGGIAGELRGPGAGSSRRHLLRGPGGPPGATRDAFGGLRAAGSAGSQAGCRVEVEGEWLNLFSGLWVSLGPLFSVFEAGSKTLRKARLFLLCHLRFVSGKLRILRPLEALLREELLASVEDCEAGLRIVVF